MLFHFDENEKKHLVGWVLPNNPSAVPLIKILTPNGDTIELEANTRRFDLRDRGLHETGMAGFYIDERALPRLPDLISNIEIRERDTDVLVYRKFQEKEHIAQKVFRFELQAMPDLKIEALFKKHFALYDFTIHRHPQDTFFGIVNNQSAKSLYIAGRPNLQQYEQWLRERDFKIITMIRDPYEEMAEKLLFARYASGSNVPGFVANYAHGLEPIIEFAKNIEFDNPQSIGVAFATITEAQKLALMNPLVRTLACLPDELPKSGHVEIALSKLARMDLVGLRNRFADFKSILSEILAVDIFENNEPIKVTWVQKVAESLSQIKQARALITLDLDLYSYVQEAVAEAIGSTALAET